MTEPRWGSKKLSLAGDPSPISESSDPVNDAVRANP
jgi:hypothetical protein